MIHVIVYVERERKMNRQGPQRHKIRTVNFLPVGEACGAIFRPTPDCGTLESWDSQERTSQLLYPQYPTVGVLN